MSGTRLARRCRFFICFGILMLFFALVAIYQNYQKMEEIHHRCEKQEEALNERLQSIVEQKFNIEKNHERDRNEQMEQRRNLELKLKELNDLLSKEKLEMSVRYDELNQAHKLLQNASAKGKKQHLQNTSLMEKQLQLAQAEFDKQKHEQQSELAIWREKYNAIVKLQANMSDTREKAQKRITNLESTIAKYQMHCDYRPHVEQQQINKPLNATHTPSLEQKTQKTFGAQELILPKTIRKLSEETNQHQDENVAVVAPPPLVAAIIDGDKMVSPLSAPRKLTSKHINASSPVSIAPSILGVPLLPLPSNQRKLPKYVAPIPANFEELLHNQKTSAHNNPIGDVNTNAADTLVVMQRNEIDDGNNNRYANVVNEMESKAQLAVGAIAANEDSGAHEIKDRDFMNEQNLKLPHVDDDNNNNAGEQQKDDDNADEDMLGAGGAADIAVKNHNHMLDAESLNNEIAGDQGKEFPEGLHLEDINEEDEDEDDYSNLAARQRGAQAIRN